MINKEQIDAFLVARGVRGHQIGHGQHGATGPEITIDGTDQVMSQRLQDACQDAGISRGGGGMSGCQIYRQIDPTLSSDPTRRAHALLEDFDATGALAPANPYQLYIDDGLNIATLSGHVLVKRDSRTEQMGRWLAKNQAGNNVATQTERPRG